MHAVPPLEERREVSITDFALMKAEGGKIVMITAYDYPTALLADRAGVDMILVGDSLGMVALGYNNTVPVTMAEMIHHTKAVARGRRYAFVVADMPFMSYQVSPAQAVVNAGRLIKEGGAHAVKLEGGREFLPQVRAIAAAGIPVMAHLGLTPQTAVNLGGYRVQGRKAAGARRILADALTLEEAGAFSVLVECIPDRIAGAIKGRLRVPLIGIGAGPDTDGQVLVISDILGLYERLQPKFVKRYVELGDQAVDALSDFAREVRTGVFPSAEHGFAIPDEELRLFNEQ